MDFSRSKIPNIIWHDQIPLSLLTSKRGTMKQTILILLLGIALSTQAQTDSLIQYVNPFAGTQRMGHTFPGATVPFGAVQLSPDTDSINYAENGKYNPRVYEYCAGYQYDDVSIVGFSHTHFSGTGHSDLGDFLIMPTTGTLKLNSRIEENPDTV